MFKIAPDGEVTIFATNLNTPSGNAFDNQGNLFQSNYGQQVVSDTITKIEPDGTASTFVSGLSGPVGIPRLQRRARIQTIEESQVHRQELTVSWLRAV